MDVTNSRECRKCHSTKPNTEFHKHKRCKNGVNSICKKCRKPLSKQHYQNTSIQKRLFNAAKSRATKLGREFNIDLHDIVVPETCPVLGHQLRSPSLDRVDSSKGYVKGNVRVISHRANMLKNNATVEELRLVIKYIEGTCP